MMEINLRTLSENVNYVKSYNKKIIAVVKNDAYGCGLIPISRFLVEKSGIKYLFVNDYEEVLELLKANLRVTILMGNPINENTVFYPNVIYTLNSLDDFKYLDIQKQDVFLHIQIDTGMNRLGFKTKDEYLLALDKIGNNPFLHLDGIYTHFVSLEEANKQLQLFKNFVNEYDYNMVHCLASSTFEHLDFGNYVRVGLALYNHQQILTIKTKAISIRKIAKGEGIGYNRAYVALKDMLIAILPIGYGNGYRLGLRNFFVYANNKRYPLVGNICMNHIFVEIDEDIDLDTEFILTSPQLLVAELAKHLGVHNYEVYVGFKFREVKYIL